MEKGKLDQLFSKFRCRTVVIMDMVTFIMVLLVGFFLTSDLAAHVLSNKAHATENEPRAT